MQRDYHDLLWGGILALFGLTVAGYAAQSYDFGDLRRMGPGFFPVVLGLILTVLGVVIAIPAWWRQTRPQPIAWREGAAVLAALMFFGFAMTRLGIAPATFIAVLIASSVAARRGLIWRLVLAVIVTLLTWAIFLGALDMPIPLFPWSR